MIACPLPVIGFCAFSGSGKTTLLTQLIPVLKSGGLRIGVLKHAHHNFEIDHPGKDSYRLRQSGTQEMLIVSDNCIAKISEVRPRKTEINLQEMLDQMDHNALDLILVEGFKHYHFPKIELHRPATKSPLIFPNDKSVIAVATDNDLLTRPAHIPVLDINNVQEIADFIKRYINTKNNNDLELEHYG